MKAHQPVEGAKPGEDVQPLDGERERFLRMYGYVGEDGDGNPPDAERYGPDYMMAENRDVEAEAKRAEEAREAEDTGIEQREGAKSRAYTALVEDRDRDKAFEAAAEATEKAAEQAEQGRERAAQSGQERSAEAQDRNDERKAARDAEKAQRKADRDRTKAERAAKADESPRAE